MSRLAQVGPRGASPRPRPGKPSSRLGRPTAGSFMAFNLTPMIDVVFNLLIYFIVGTTFLRAEGVLPSRMAHLGSAADSQAIPVTPIRLILSQAPGPEQRLRIRLEGSAAVPQDFEDLCRILVNLRTGGIGFDAATPVVVHAQDQVAWDHVVNAYNAAKRAGYESINFGTARPSE
jgi:biopolymer transport protein ExbD